MNREEDELGQQDKRTLTVNQMGSSENHVENEFSADVSA